MTKPIVIFELKDEKNMIFLINMLSVFENFENPPVISSKLSISFILILQFTIFMKALFSRNKILEKTILSIIVEFSIANNNEYLFENNMS